jgi:uncharacterized protein (TIGR00730 family)
MNKRKVIPSLRSLADQERATAKKARASWQMFTIMAEFIEATEYLSEIRPAVSIYGSARLKPNSPYYKLATQIARKLSDAGFAVISGGGPGIMEAANRGAREAGGKTIGLNIRLPFEQGANPYITEGLHFEFHYFFMRKFWFAYLAKALVIFPGGFGTLDELFEILTLVQTDKLSKQIGVVLYGREYWDQVLTFQPMAEWGAIAEHDVDLLHYAETPADAFEHLRDHLIAHHLEPHSEQEAATPGIAKTRG